MSEIDITKLPLYKMPAPKEHKIAMGIRLSMQAAQDVDALIYDSKGLIRSRAHALEVLVLEALEARQKRQG